MNLKNAVVLITGANRGLGLALAKAALAHGARKVYAAARDPSAITLAGVIPVRLDVTNPDDVERVAAELGDVSVLVNNAGISLGGSTFGAADKARQEMEVNVFGPMTLSAAFAPVLARNGGGAIVNILSALSWISFPSIATYCISKSAAWSLTNSIRAELRGQGTQVLAAHMGYMDTDMTKGVEAPKASPADVANAIFSALAAGKEEVLADETSRQVRLGLGAANGAYLGAAA